jgi:hypothetical protein
MAAIMAIVFAAAAGFAFVVLIAIVVTIGVRREEREWTLKSGRAPGFTAQLARLVLGCEIRPRYERRRPDRTGAGAGRRR